MSPIKMKVTYLKIVCIHLFESSLLNHLSSICLFVCCSVLNDVLGNPDSKKLKLHGLSPRANYTDRATDPSGRIPSVF
jgi:hypothetical protein